MSLKEKKEQEKVLKAQIRQRSEQKKEELCNLMVNYPEVWNKSCPEFRDRQLQAVKWEEISNIMKMSTKDAKALWKYLKDTFRTNFHAVSKKKSGQEYVEDEDINLVKWPFFKSLMFLKDTVSRRDTFCNLGETVEDDNGETAEQILNDMANGNTPDDIEEPCDEGDEYNDSTLSKQDPPPGPSTCSAKQYPPSGPSTCSAKQYPPPGPSTSHSKPDPPQGQSTRASTATKNTKKRKRVEDTDADEVTNEISKIDEFLAASIAHKCQKNAETRPQRFCKYLADLLCQVPEEAQLDCELELIGVVQSYIRNKNQSD